MKPLYYLHHSFPLSIPLNMVAVATKTLVNYTLSTTVGFVHCSFFHLLCLLYHLHFFAGLMFITQKIRRRASFCVRSEKPQLLWCLQVRTLSGRRKERERGKRKRGNKRSSKEKHLGHPRTSHQLSPARMWVVGRGTLEPVSAVKCPPVVAYVAPPPSLVFSPAERPVWIIECVFNMRERSMNEDVEAN